MSFFPPILPQVLRETRRMDSLKWLCRILCLHFIMSLQFQNIDSSAEPLASTSPLPPPKQCPAEQRRALLQFKNSTFSDCTSSWDESTDCCSWESVTCDKVSGQVLELHLSDCGFEGVLHANSSLFLLHDLNYLYLSDNDKLNIGNHGFSLLAQNLKKLRTLALDSVNMSSVSLCSLQNLSSSLRYLSLSRCNLHGEIPSEILSLPCLQYLDLSWNSDLRGHLPKSNWSSQLMSLDLSYTSFSGELSDSLGSLRLLTELYLDGCQFTGSIPLSFGNLTELISLSLSDNNLRGKIPDFFDNFGKLTGYVHFDSNNFMGLLPPSLFNLSSIEALDLSSNQLVGPIPYNVSGLLATNFLYLQNNFLSGGVPSWLLTLSRGFIELDLSSNSLKGSIDSDLLSKAKYLRKFDISKNSMIISSSNSGNGTANFTFSQLDTMSFSSCNIGKFPSFLRTAKRLGFLDLSYNNIHGSISKWEAEGWEGLNTLDLSNNFLTDIEQIPGNHLKFVDLRSNLLRGSLPLHPQSSISNFFVSNNKLTGEFPSSLLCNSSSDMTVLDMSWNSFSGRLPDCFENYSQGLFVLDLQMNNFHGRIPSLANSQWLTSLNLNGNRFEGGITRSLVNCSWLEVLDLGNNNLNDTFPDWLDKLPELKVLVLRSNRLHGSLKNSTTKSPFLKLRIIDLSHNEFTGLLPDGYFRRLNAMKDLHEDNITIRYMGTTDNYYHDSVTITIKSQVVQLERILTIFTTMDFSSNQFHGQIPEVLGELDSLLLINMSHNSLTGPIPSSLGRLEALESLDLSANKLEGQISVQLTNLNFLEILNLSHNNLVGPIPRGKQFDTFSNDSYEGNLGLCGFPLSKSCCQEEECEAPPPTINDDDDSATAFVWKFAVAGYGCGLVFGVSIAYIVFKTGKPWRLVKLIEEFELKHLAKQRRRDRRRN